jgi:hypothetical protein
VQKERINRYTFSEIIMDIWERIFLANGENINFFKSFQKNPPEVTPILYMESNRHYVEKLCAKGEKS